ncbi:MAG: hypothetical protein ACRD3W_05470 [Terriglobales bacterium]
MKKQGEPWYRRLFVSALLWLVCKVLEPVPILAGLANIVAFAV